MFTIKKFAIVGLLAVTPLFFSPQADANQYGNMGTNGTSANVQGNYNTNFDTDRDGTMNQGVRTTATERRGANWGWLGLLGLVGLAGMRGRNQNPDPNRT